MFAVFWLAFCAGSGAYDVVQYQHEGHTLSLITVAIMFALAAYWVVQMARD